jgi:hypothetical protein
MARARAGEVRRRAKFFMVSIGFQAGMRLAALMALKQGKNVQPSRQICMTCGGTF